MMISICNGLAPFGYNLALGGARGKHSAATKALIGSYHKGKIVTQSTRDKLSKTHTGRKCSSEHIAAMVAGRNKFLASKDVEHPVYIFDCITHEIISENKPRSITLKDNLDVSIHSLRRSLNSSKYKFKFNDRFCYARYGNTPESGFYFDLGVKVIITHQDGHETMFANLGHARAALNLSRGCIEGCIKRKSTQFYVNDLCKLESYTAQYADQVK